MKQIGRPGDRAGKSLREFGQAEPPAKEKAMMLSIKFAVGNLLFTVNTDANFFRDEGDYSFPYHNHREYELHYIVAGQGQVNLSGRIVDVGPGACFLIPPYMYHEHIDSGDTPVRRHCFKFSFRRRGGDGAPPIALEEGAYLSGMLAMNEGIVLRRAPQILTHITQIQQELTTCSVGYYTTVQALFSRIIVEIVRAAAEDTRLSLSDDIKREELDRHRSEIIGRFFGKCYMFDVKAVDLASILRISERHLGRVMLDNYGVTFRQMLIDVRIRMGMKFLVATDESIERIAEMVGYGEASNFSNAFKKKLSVSPSAYREQARRELPSGLLDNGAGDAEEGEKTHA